MFFGLTSPWTSARLVARVVCSERVEAGGEGGVRPPCRAQVRLDPDRLERVVMREGGGHARVGGAQRMNVGEVASDAGREFRLGAAGQEPRLPERKVLWRQILHREQAGFRVFAEDLGNRARQPERDRAHPGGLRPVALDRRLPQGRDLKPGQRPLHAEPAPAGLDQGNVGGDAAGQRRHAGGLSLMQQAEEAEGLGEIAASA